MVLGCQSKVKFPAKYDAFTKWGMCWSIFFFQGYSFDVCKWAVFRFCQKDLKCRGNKVPHISLFKIVKNKDSVEFSGVLANLASSLGFELRKDSKLSDVSCLRLLPTFAGVLREKIRMRASFNTILTNYTSEESLINVVYNKNIV